MYSFSRGIIHERKRLPDLVVQAPRLDFPRQLRGGSSARAKTSGRVKSKPLDIPGWAYTAFHISLITIVLNIVSSRPF